MTHPTIQGERTTLRPVVPADLDLLTGWLSDPEVYRWWGGSPKSREEIPEQFMERQPGFEPFIVEAAGEPIGYLQYWTGDATSGGIDMFLVPSKREQGLGPDAARAAVRYLIDDLGWRRVTVDPYADNQRAQRAWAKAGFRFERELPDHPDGPSILMVVEATAPPIPSHRSG